MSEEETKEGWGIAESIEEIDVGDEGEDGTVEEVVLDWGDATECLLTRIVAVGPEGHLLTRQRPEEPSPVSIVCLFAPDGSFVLSLPPDPDRRWIGFSDPVQWY